MPSSNEREAYDGRYVIRFESKRHVYRVRDKETANEWLPKSISGRLSVINKPALVGWAAKLAAETGDKNAHRKESQKSAKRGTAVHAAVEEFLTEFPGQPEEWLKTLNAEIRPYVNGFLGWWEDYSPDVIATEHIVFSRMLKTCGTADLLARINGVETVIDFKTSKGIYPEMALQISFYARALHEEGRMPGHRGIVQLKPNGSYDYWDEERIKEMAGGTHECIDVVKGCITINDWQKRKR